MRDSSLRARLEVLNRGPLPASATPHDAAAASAAVASAIGHPSSCTPTQSVVTTTTPTKAPPFSAAGLLRGGDVIDTPAGEHLRIRLPLDAIWPGGERLVAGRQEHLCEQLALAQRAVEPNIAMHPDFAAFVAALPDRVLLLDLETCGLAGSALFLAGLLRRVDDRPTVELLLARNYAEEAAVLASLWQALATHDVLVTFNGKSFDWPMVRDRSIRYRLKAFDAPRELRHVDVLHHARRRWRRGLPDCRLQTLERHVCRRGRTGDIPGHRIPAVYADFVRTGFEREMDAVLYHNAVDLVTLLDLTLRLAG